MVSGGVRLAAACHAITKQLEDAECPDAAFDAADLCLLVTGQSVHTSPDVLLTQAQAEQLSAVANRRANREPLQYIWGEWSFLNFNLKVGPGVLCPRADTEVVVELAAKTLQGCVQPKVLELCGGSGCIALGIKMFCPAAKVTVLEKSEAALPYLRENAAHALEGCKGLEGVAAPYAEVVEGDLFTYHESLPSETFDLLISNPPYLTAAEMAVLQPEVAQEPAMALDGGEDGLVFYRAIAEHYKRVVKQGGWLALEIGAAQAADVISILENAGWGAVSCQKDYAQNDRCILAKRGDCATLVVK